MRLNPEHVKKLARAFEIGPDGERHVKIDIEAMLAASLRLSLWERGLLWERLLMAAKAKRVSKDQRVLLALFASTDDTTFPISPVMAEVAHESEVTP